MAPSRSSTGSGDFKGIIRAWDLACLIARGVDLDATPAGEVVFGQRRVMAEQDIDAAQTIWGAEGGELMPVVDGTKFVGTLSHFDFRAHGLLVETIGERAYNIVMDISPDDPMYHGHRGTYMLASASALEWIMCMLGLEHDGEPSSILDMGSGYGRVTRALRAAFPGVSITACDTDPAAIDFCRHAFDAQPVLADEDPAATKLDGEYDVIWAGSLLPTLPVERWPKMLDLLGTHLSENGVLIVTTLAWQSSPILRELGVPDEAIGSLWQDYEARGFAHQSHLEPNGNGSRLTLAAPGWVRWVVHSSKLLRVAQQREGVWESPRPREDVIACVHPFRSDE